VSNILNLGPLSEPYCSLDCNRNLRDSPEFFSWFSFLLSHYPGRIGEISSSDSYEPKASFSFIPFTVRLDLEGKRETDKETMKNSGLVGTHITTLG
jgi:hypothetical protein